MKHTVNERVFVCCCLLSNIKKKNWKSMWSYSPTLLSRVSVPAWRWLLDPVHGYLVREAYRFLTSYDEQMDRSLVDDV